ncbi:O-METHYLTRANSFERASE [Salix viminalis]|uniref:O-METHYLTRANSFERASE n=1 Tax=Salix viminalis TaxID=40686 RepID=A0A9Q0SAS9_SALVM|nr:O-METHYLTRANSFERASE [Salix viminalis]
MDADQGHGVSELFKAQSHLYKHIYYFIESMSLKCAVQLGIPDIIHKNNQPTTLPQLVSALNIPVSKANFLQRLMRILVHSGVFDITKICEDQEGGGGGYVLTSSSRLLLKDSPANLSPAVLAVLDPVLLSPWFSLGQWIQGEERTPFEAYHGTSFWEYGKRNVKFNNNLNEAMASDSQVASLVVKEHKEIFESVDSLVDVGGGTGNLARSIAEAYPHMRCTVVDLPQVVANLPESKNLKFVGGDMFKSIPSADAIIMKSVLLNWSDEDCIKILKRCREAIPSTDDGGKLVLVEMVINDRKDEHELTKTRLFVDMEMMLICNGRGRSEKEWKKLFLEAGFSHYKITATSGLNDIIEVYP